MNPQYRAQRVPSTHRNYWSFWPARGIAVSYRPARRGLMASCVLAALISASVAQAANDVWDGNNPVPPTPPSGLWSTGANWVDNTVPGSLDSATFNLPFAYVVSFNAIPSSIHGLSVSAGSVSFAGSNNLLNVTSSSGGQDINVSGNNTQWFVGTSASPLRVIAGDDLSIQGGSAVVQIGFGSDIEANDFSTAGLNGVLIVDGQNSGLFIDEDSNVGGAAVGSNLLLIRNNANANFYGKLGIAQSTTVGARGTVSVQGTGSLLEVQQDLNLATGDISGQIAQLEVLSEGTVTVQYSTTVGSANLGSANLSVGVSGTGNAEFSTDNLTINATGTVTVGSGNSATRGTLNVDSSLRVDGGTFHVRSGSYFDFPSTVTIENGGLADVWSVADHYVYFSEFAVFTVRGAGSILTSDAAFLSFGDYGFGGRLTIEAGGVANFMGGSLAGGAYNAGTEQVVALVTGPGSEWNLGLDLEIGRNRTSSSDTGAGQLTVDNGGAVTVGESLVLRDSGTVTIDNAELTIGSLVIKGGTIVFTSGKVHITDHATLDRIFVDTTLGPTHALRPLQHLAVDGTATLTSSLILDGGTLSVGELQGSSQLHIARGVFNLTDDELFVQSGGLFGDRLEVGADTTINVTRGIYNNGIVTGDGQIGGPFYNLDTGELRAEPGHSLTLTGAGCFNQGRIQLLGGLLEYTQSLTNARFGGLISGNGTLRVAGGLVNNGVMSFSGAANIMGDVTNSATGLIIASGGGPTTFFDDVVNQGTIRTSAGSFSVFFGSVTGSGSFTGLGTVNLEGDLMPGSSPAVVEFGGDLVLGPAASLVMEIGGVNPGTNYDQLAIAGHVAWDGTLQVEFINGFTPLFQTDYVIATYASRIGEFGTVELPPLPNGLEWSLDYGPNSLTLSVDSVLLPGDINLDGTVDRTDAALFSPFFGRQAASIWTTGDFNGDHATTLADWVLLQSNLGQSLAPSPAAVPEPASLLIALSAVAWTILVTSTRRRGCRSTNLV